VDSTVSITVNHAVEEPKVSNTEWSEVERQNSYGEGGDTFDADQHPTRRLGASLPLGSGRSESQGAVLSSIPPHMRGQRSGSVTLSFLRSASGSTTSLHKRLGGSNKKKRFLQRSGSIVSEMDCDAAATRDVYPNEGNNGSGEGGSTESKMSLLDQAIFKWSSMRRLDVDARSESNLSLASAAGTFKQKMNQVQPDQIENVHVIIWSSFSTVLEVKKQRISFYSCKQYLKSLVI
jgi:hypothetical protein